MIEKIVKGWDKIDADRIEYQIWKANHVKLDEHGNDIEEDNKLNYWLPTLLFITFCISWGDSWTLGYTEGQKDFKAKISSEEINQNKTLEYWDRPIRRQR